MKTQYGSAHQPGARLKPITLITLQAFAALGVSAHAWADALPQLAAVEFNEQFLDSGSAEKLDISRFNKGQQVLPGTYRADTYVNNTWRGKFSVDVRDSVQSPG